MLEAQGLNLLRGEVVDGDLLGLGLACEAESLIASLDPPASV